MGQQDMTAVVLAGGQSRRFGSDKASALLAGRPLLAWAVSAVSEACSRVLVVRAEGQQLPALPEGLPIRAVDDRYVRRGPLAGLASAFPHVDTELCFAVSCDAPLLRPAIVSTIAARAEGVDAAVPRVHGFPQPLVACYRPATCLPAFERALAAGENSILDALRGLLTVEVNEAAVRRVDRDLDSFRNVNDPAALADLEALVLRRRAGQAGG